MDILKIVLTYVLTIYLVILIGRMILRLDQHVRAPLVPPEGGQAHR